MVCESPMQAQPGRTPGGVLGLRGHIQLRAGYVFCLSLSWWQGALGATQGGCKKVRELQFCWDRGDGREHQGKAVWGGRRVCRSAGNYVLLFACLLCPLKPFLDCARYSLVVWVKMCGLQIDSCRLREALFW